MRAVMEWLRLNDELRAKIRSHSIQTIQPHRPLTAAARDLLRQGRSNQTELQRVLGQYEN